jgi:hypothetical protein
MVGYDRYEGDAACRQLAALYGVLRLYNNFFQPSMKLVSKERKGARVLKKYDKAQTPYQRVLAEPTISDVVKESLRIEYARLDPVELLRQVEHLQNLLWQYAHRPANWTTAEQPIVKAESTAGTVTDIGNQMIRAHEPEALTHGIELERTRRTYRTTKKPRKPFSGKPFSGPRYWRTRPDPFAEVWPQLQEQLEQNPFSETKQLWQQLQQRYPEQFKDGQLRTLQRRVKAWREARSVPCPGVILPVDSIDHAAVMTAASSA